MAAEEEKKESKGWRWQWRDERQPSLTQLLSHLCALIQLHEYTHTLTHKHRDLCRVRQPPAAAFTSWHGLADAGSHGVATPRGGEQKRGEGGWEEQERADEERQGWRMQREKNSKEEESGHGVVRRERKCWCGGGDKDAASNTGSELSVLRDEAYHFLSSIISIHHQACESKTVSCKHTHRARLRSLPSLQCSWTEQSCSVQGTAATRWAHTTGG